MPPRPVVCEPVFHARPWGGRRLERRFGKALPPDVLVGESWELAGLEACDTRVRAGPLAGRSVSELVAEWGRDLTGGAALVDGRFPLLVKFLDAREALSVQVHPRPPAGDPGALAGGVKHEAWYVIEADRGAELLIGLREGVTPADVQRAAGSADVVALLRRWPARAGQCYYLPSGTPHALGAGILVAEVQTPADVTYRLYDWDRAGLDGRPRPLHVEPALANVRYDVDPGMIRQPRSHLGAALATVSRLMACERFMIDKLRLSAGLVQGLPHAEMVIWIVLDGRGALLERGARASPEDRCAFAGGDVVLVPAACAGIDVHVESDCELLEVKVPVLSSLRGLPHPPAEPRDVGAWPGPVPLTRRPPGG